MAEITCPHCQGLLQLEEEVPEEEVEWLGCIPWTGEESALPNNGEIRCPGMNILDFVKEVVRAPVSNAVIKVVVNEDVYNTVVSVYGERGIVMCEADSGNLITRKEWKDKYGTDGIALWAIKSMYHQDTGYGVKPEIVAKPPTGGIIARPPGAGRIPVKIGKGR